MSKEQQKIGRTYHEIAQLVEIIYDDGQNVELPVAIEEIDRLANLKSLNESEGDKIKIFERR